MASNDSNILRNIIGDVIVVPILNKRYNLYLVCTENTDSRENDSMMSMPAGGNQTVEERFNSLEFRQRIDPIHASSLVSLQRSGFDDVSLIGLSQLFKEKSSHENSLIQERPCVAVNTDFESFTSDKPSLEQRVHIDEQSNHIDENNNTLTDSVHFNLSVDSNKVMARAVSSSDSDNDLTIVTPRRPPALIRIKFKKKSKRSDDSGHATDDTNVAVQPRNLRRRARGTNVQPAVQRRQRKTYFYHYTSRANLESIKNDRIILGSNGIYGNGVYGTSKPPQAKCITILRNNYLLNPNDSLVQNVLPFVECYVRLSVDDLGAQLRVPDARRPDVYMYQGNIDLNAHQFKTGVRKRFNAEMILYADIQADD